MFGNCKSGKPSSTDKVVGYPFGENAFGFIAYHPIGFMSVNIAAPNRVRIPTEDPFAGDPKLLALDAKGYLSYCGPFSIVSENEVIHHLKLYSFENWVGTDQHRHAQFDLNKDTLTLSTAPTDAGAKGQQSPDLEAHELNTVARLRRVVDRGRGRDLWRSAFMALFLDRVFEKPDRRVKHPTLDRALKVPA